MGCSNGNNSLYSFIQSGKNELRDLLTWNRFCCNARQNLQVWVWRAQFLWCRIQSDAMHMFLRKTPRLLLLTLGARISSYSYLQKRLRGRSNQPLMAAMSTLTKRHILTLPSCIVLGWNTQASQAVRFRNCTEFWKKWFGDSRYSCLSRRKEGRKPEPREVLDRLPKCWQTSPFLAKKMKPVWPLSLEHRLTNLLDQHTTKMFFFGLLKGSCGALLTDSVTILPLADISSSPGSDQMFPAGSFEG